MAFRDRLFATIRAARPVLEVPGVLVVGSEVPNLLEPDSASTLVVSQNLNVGVPVSHHAAVKAQLDALREFDASADEPSVWPPRAPGLLELNFIGMDPAQDPAEAYVLEDDRLPLLVFGALTLVSRGAEVEIEGTGLALPRPAGLLLEKLVTDRTGEKGEREMLVALGVLSTSRAGWGGSLAAAGNPARSRRARRGAHLGTAPRRPPHRRTAGGRVPCAGSVRRRLLIGASQSR